MGHQVTTQMVIIPRRNFKLCINNQPPFLVCYQEVDLPANFPNNLRRFIPNMYWDTHMDPLSNQMRVVALVALRDIKDGEELFSTYMDIV
jgi:hypothetical protein